MYRAAQVRMDLSWRFSNVVAQIAGLRVRGKSSLPHRGRMGYAYQQTFRSQQPRDDLAPGFLSRRNQQFVALRFQFGGGIFDIPYVKFDPRLWHRKIARPLIRAKNDSAACANDHRAKCFTPSSPPVCR